MFLTHPRGFADPAHVTERLAMLGTEPGVQPLRAWAHTLEQDRGVTVPQFDPAEAGIDAKVLFVLEAPGPMTNAGNPLRGSGFISVDNDDETAAFLWRCRAAAHLSDGVLHWNIVPWYLGDASVKPNAAELTQGGADLRELLKLLPYLEVVVLCGSYARNGWRKHVAPYLANSPEVLTTWHPSKRGVISQQRKNEFAATVRQAAELLAGR
ncbi:uracil-DNA glycosylase [Microbacterium sp. VKM Ac-2923]|uniref:uracil-DNA glycosylase n=1 Tax=Microbacterium sp. VKM Ac-2923 TaxID=2929476 RepID=UPI001FB5052E|nr:uracil-DNA glycosylase [Microbacterium sp. VKM Ac-2923]MCJ1707853.1 uracil-DNA glycosylase [Microbacterium sp. VKM Ac-2923]